MSYGKEDNHQINAYEYGSVLQSGHIYIKEGENRFENH